MAAEYRVLVDTDYPPNRHAAAGEVVSDLPGKSIKWLLEQGLIQKASEEPAPLYEVATPDLVADSEDLSAEQVAPDVAEEAPEVATEDSAPTPSEGDDA